MPPRSARLGEGLSGTVKQRQAGDFAGGGSRADVSAVTGFCNLWAEKITKVVTFLWIGELVHGIAEAEQVYYGQIEGVVGELPATVTDKNKKQGGF